MSVFLHLQWFLYKVFGIYDSEMLFEVMSDVIPNRIENQHAWVLGKLGSICLGREFGASMIFLMEG